MDVSETMGAEKYNSTSTALGYTLECMKAYKGTLLEPTDPNPTEFSGPEFFNFDIVACSMSLHHFDDPAYALQQLARRARPDGGVVIVIDSIKASAFHKLYQQVAEYGVHVVMGYSEKEMSKYYEGAGAAAEFAYVALEEGPEIDMGMFKEPMKVFISKGKRSE